MGEFSDPFLSSYTLNTNGTSADGNWFCVSDGSGVWTSGNKVMNISPSTSVFGQGPGLLFKDVMTDFHCSVNVKTLSQTRKPNPNPWEMGWILWHWNDNTHFYGCNFQRNKFELMKYDGGVNPTNEIIIKQNLGFSAALGRDYPLDIQVTGNAITIKVDGNTVISLTDSSSYSSGKLMLYCEDSVVNFSHLCIDY